MWTWPASWISPSRRRGIMSKRRSGKQTETCPNATTFAFRLGWEWIFKPRCAPLNAGEMGKMKSFFWVACGLALGCLVPYSSRAAAETRLVTLDDLSRLRDVDDPRISPDGAWVAYTVTTQNLEIDKKQSDLWMTSWDGTTTVRLTKTPNESESSP